MKSVICLADMPLYKRMPSGNLPIHIRAALRQIAGGQLLTLLQKTFIEIDDDTKRFHAAMSRIIRVVQRCNDVPHTVKDHPFLSDLGLITWSREMIPVDHFQELQLEKYSCHPSEYQEASVVASRPKSGITASAGSPSEYETDGSGPPQHQDDARACSSSAHRTARFGHPSMHMPVPSAKPCPPSGPISSRHGIPSFSSDAARVFEWSGGTRSS